MDTSVWIDLTDLASWTGNLTGIQRVTYEYAKRFEEDGARFCVFDETDDHFFEIRLSELSTLQGAVSGRQVIGGKNSSRKRRMRQVIGKPYYMLSESRKAMLRPLVSAANFYARYGISKIEKTRRNTSSISRSNTRIVFRKNDTVILLGASWNDQVVLDNIVKLKEEEGFILVQHINDLLPIYQPQLFSDELPGKFRPYINKVIHHADIITVISEATKRDVTAYCKENDVSDVRIEVVRLGEDIKSDKPLRPIAIRPKEQFILAVGTFEVRKNYTLLYQVVKLAQLEGHDIPRIVIAGRRGWLTNDLEHTLQLDPFAKERILWLDNVSDEELSWLYENCMFTIFPSLAEGWGLPIVESLHHGKMVLSSGVSSMLEIGDGLVDYFLPYDARECLNKILFYVTDERYVKKNSSVVAHYRPYSWDSSYRRLLDVVTSE